MDIDKLESKFESVLREFEREVIPLLRSSLRDQGYIYTSELYNTLEFKSVKISPHEWELFMNFPSYGRVLEKKNPFAFNAPVQQMVKWVLATGLDKFKSVPGYENSNFVPTKAAERIAWGIKMSKRKYEHPAPYHIRDFNNPLQTSWFYKPFFGMWAMKRDRLVMAYFEHYPKEVVREIRHTYQEAMSNLGKYGGSRIKRNR